METYSRRGIMVGAIAVAAAAPFAFSRMAGAAEPVDDGYTVMKGDGRFSEWVHLVTTGGLMREAMGNHPYTCFAPTDDAMAPFSAQYSAMLGITLGNGGSAPEMSWIVRVVRSHTVPGIHPPSEFEGKKVTLKSYYGTDLEIDGTSQKLVAIVKRPDTTAVQQVDPKPLMASNAIIYPVDSVTVIR